MRVRRQITKLQLSGHWTAASTQEVLPTPADRTFTTAKRIGGRLLLVDSMFGFSPAQAAPQDRVVTIKRF